MYFVLKYKNNYKIIIQNIELNLGEEHDCLFTITILLMALPMFDWIQSSENKLLWLEDYFACF